jgi:5-methylcytosine-specific restriction endonuclease McrA
MTDRVSGKCGVCGLANPETLETHHVVPRRYGGTDAPENLVDLCGSCHNAVERIYGERFYERLKNVLGDEPPASIDELGHEPDVTTSPDRELPEHPQHANYTDSRIQLVIEEGWATEKEIARYLLGEEWPLIEEHGEDYGEEALETLRGEHWKRTTISCVHCGYCSRVFLPWEHHKCVKHLRLSHRISKPYEEETELVMAGSLFDTGTNIDYEERPKSHPGTTPAEPRTTLPSSSSPQSMEEFKEQLEEDDGQEESELGSEE